MSPVRRDVLVAVLMSAVVAAMADLRPPTLEQTTTFIAVAVERHHAAIPVRGDWERAWSVRVEFSGCSIEKMTSHEDRMSVARWRLVDTDAAAVRVTRETRDGCPSFLVTLHCKGDRACVDGGAGGLDRLSYFEFASEQVAHRVAAAFRHVTNLCQREEDAGQAEGRFVEVPEAPATIQ